MAKAQTKDSEAGATKATTRRPRKTGADQGAPRKRRPNRTSWKVGQSGNPKGRPRTGESLAEVVRAEASNLAIVKKMQWLADNAESETVRYHALTWLAERGNGKAPQEVVVHEGNAYARRVKGLTIPQLEALAAIDEPLEPDEGQEPDAAASPGLN